MNNQDLSNINNFVYNFSINTLGLSPQAAKYVTQNNIYETDGETYVMLSINKNIEDNMDEDEDLTRQDIDGIESCKGMIVRFSDSLIVCKSYPKPISMVYENMELADGEYEEYINGLIVRIWVDNGSIFYSSVNKIDISTSKFGKVDRPFLDIVLDFIKPDSDMENFLIENSNYTHTFMICADEFQINTRKTIKFSCVYLDSFDNSLNVFPTVYDEDMREIMKEFIDQNGDENITYLYSANKDEASSILSSPLIPSASNWSSTGSVIYRTNGRAVTIKSPAAMWRDNVNGGINDCYLIFSRNLVQYLEGNQLLYKVGMSPTVFEQHKNAILSQGISIFNQNINGVRMYESDEPSGDPVNIVKTNMLYSVPLAFIDDIEPAVSRYINSLRNVIEYLYSDRVRLLSLNKARDLQTVSGFGNTAKVPKLTRAGKYLSERMGLMLEPNMKSDYVNNVVRNPQFMYSVKINNKGEPLQPLEITQMLIELLNKYKRSKKQEDLMEFLIKSSIADTIARAPSEIITPILVIPEKVISQRNAHQRIAQRK